MNFVFQIFLDFPLSLYEIVQSSYSTCLCIWPKLVACFTKIRQKLHFQMRQHLLKPCWTFSESLTFSRFQEYRVLESIAECYRVLQSVTGCYRVLQSVTECYRVLQSVTECYRVLQSITQCYRVFGLLLSATEYNIALQTITEYYRVLQSITEYYRI